MKLHRFILLTVLASLAFLALVLLCSGTSKADLRIGEVYDEGEKGDDQFVELFNPHTTPVALSAYYLSVLEDPTGEGTEYGKFDLTTYDDDGLLDSNEFLVVTDDLTNLKSYNRMGVYRKVDNALMSEVGWSWKGMAPDPVEGMSAQIPWDSAEGEYAFDTWTLASPTKELRNQVAVPDFDSPCVVINEVNDDYIELFNIDWSTVNLAGYRIAGDEDFVTLESGTTLDPGKYLLIHETSLSISPRDTGGDMKLFNELGVLIDVISWDPAGSRADTSTAARHLDGLGGRGIYREEDANDDYSGEPNLWWEFGVDETEGESNYDGPTILVDGLPEVYDYLDDPGNGYAKGVVEGEVEEMGYLTPWNIIFYSGAVGNEEALCLTKYLEDSKGRLYLEANDFAGLANDHEIFFDMLHIATGEFDDYVSGVVRERFFQEELKLQYDDSEKVLELVRPTPNACRLFYQETNPRNRFSSVYLENPTTGYRVICSSLSYEHLEADSNNPEDLLGIMIEWLSDPDVNYRPLLGLLEGQVGTTGLVDDEERISQLGWLGWENQDPDYWDQDRWQRTNVYGHDMYKFIEFTIYIDTDEDTVEEFDEGCELVATGNSTFYKPTDLEPGHYYWTVMAKDKFGLEGGALDEDEDPVIFSFYYDNKKPEILSIKPYFDGGPGDNGTEMLGYYSDHGYFPTFGPRGEGSPEGVLFQAHDGELGLSFTQMMKTELGLRFVSTDPKVEGKMWDMGDIGILARDGGPTNSLEGQNTAEFIMDAPAHILDDDDTFHQGRYTISYRIVDLVGNYIEDQIIFMVDTEAPDPAHDLEIKPQDVPIYENTGISYLKAGEIYYLMGIGPTYMADGTLSNIKYFIANKASGGDELLIANFSGNDLSSAEDEKEYWAMFEATKGYHYFYAICYDRAGNWAKSDVMNTVMIDAFGPVVSDLEFGLKADGDIWVSGEARDSIDPDSASGAFFVMIKVNGYYVTHSSSGVYSWWNNREYNAGDVLRIPVSGNEFNGSFTPTVVSSLNGDVKNVVQVQGVDKVLNYGNLSSQDDSPQFRVVSSGKSKYIWMEEGTDISLYRDQLTEIRLSITDFPDGDTDYHLLVFPYHNETPEVADGYLSPWGIWEIDTDLEGDLEATLRIYYQLSARTRFVHVELEPFTREDDQSDWIPITEYSTGKVGDDHYFEINLDSFSQFAIGQDEDTLQEPQKPEAEILAVSPDPGIAGENISFEAASDTLFKQYIWKSSIDGEFYNGSLARVNISSLSAGEHTITHLVHDRFDYWSPEVETTLTIHERPEVDIFDIDPSLLLVGENFVIDWEATDDGTIEEYSWRCVNETGFEVYNSSEVPTSLPLGIYDVYFTARDNYGVWSEELKYGEKIIVHEKPQAVIDKVSPQVALLGETVEFSGSGVDDGSIQYYIWTSSIAGELFYSNTGGFSTASLPAGNHTLSFEVIDDNSCWSDKVFSYLVIHSRPVATINSVTPSQAIPEDTVVFNGSGTDDGEITAFLWMSDLDGELYNGSNALFSPSGLSLGQHNISLRVRDDHGVWSERVFTLLLVHQRPLAIIKSVTPGPILLGETVVFNGSGIDDGEIVLYHWWSETGGDLHNGSEGNFSSSGLSPGINGVYLEVMDDNGAWSEKAFVEIYIHTKPTATIELIDPAPALLGQEILFKGKGVDDTSISRYLWKSSMEGELRNGSEAEFRISDLSLGSHNITLQVMDNFGVWSEEVSQVIIINQRPEASILDISPGVVLLGEEAVFQGAGSDDGIIQTYRWSSSIDGEFYNDTKDTFSYQGLSLGRHVITLQVMDDLGVWSTEVESSLLVNGRPTVEILSISPRPALDTTSVSFSGKATDDGEINRLVWRSSIDGELYNGTETSFSHTSMSKGEHTIFLRAQDKQGAWSLETNTSLSIHSIPTAEIAQDIPLKVEEKENVNFKGTGVDDNAIVRYVWNSSIDGEFYNGTKGEFGYANLSRGTHKITLRVMDEHGAWSKPVSITLKVEKEKDEALSLATKLGPLPIYGYLAILLLGIFLALGLVRNRDGATNGGSAVLPAQAPSPGQSLPQSALAPGSLLQGQPPASGAPTWQTGGTGAQQPPASQPPQFSATGQPLAQAPVFSPAQTPTPDPTTPSWKGQKPSGVPEFKTEPAPAPVPELQGGVPELPMEPEPSPTGWDCPKCQSSVDEKFHFCIKCGQKRPEEGETNKPPAKEETNWSCSGCGKNVGSQFRFCIHCGKGKPGN